MCHGMAMKKKRKDFECCSSIGSESQEHRALSHSSQGSES